MFKINYFISGKKQFIVFLPLKWLLKVLPSEGTIEADVLKMKHSGFLSGSQVSAYIWPTVEGYNFSLQSLCLHLKPLKGKCITHNLAKTVPTICPC